AIAHGARVVAVRGPFDAALAVVRTLAEQGEATLVNSVNPDRLEGQKTAAFELCETFGDAPDALFIPVGNAGNITAYWKGFVEAAAAAAIAGLRKRARANGLRGASRVVCVLTGNGMKDPERARSLAGGDIATVEATPDAVRAALRS